METKCNETTINVPKEECVQAFEKKCETDYKVIEHYSYNEECSEVIEEVCKEHVEVPVPVEVPYPVPVPKPVEVPVYKEKIIEVPKYKPVYQEKIIDVPKFNPVYHPPEHSPAYNPPELNHQKSEYRKPPPKYLPAESQYRPPTVIQSPNLAGHHHIEIELREHAPVPAVPQREPHLPQKEPHSSQREPLLPHHFDPHHPVIPPHPDPTPLPSFTPPTQALKHHGPHLHHDLEPPELHDNVHLDTKFVTALPNLDPLKASIVDKFNKQLIRTKRDSNSEPDPFPHPEAVAEPDANPKPVAVADPDPKAIADAVAKAIAVANAEAAARGDPRLSIHDMSIQELQDLLQSLNKNKVIKSSSQRPALGEHVLDLSRFKGTSKLTETGNSQQFDFHSGSQSILSTPSHQNSHRLLGGDFLGDPFIKGKLTSVSPKKSPDSISLFGSKPKNSVFSIQNQEPLRDDFAGIKNSDLISMLNKKEALHQNGDAHSDTLSEWSLPGTKQTNLIKPQAQSHLPSSHSLSVTQAG